MSQQGQFLQSDFFDNKEGLNLSDSPFKVTDGQATFGQNYQYTQTGGIRKRQGHPYFNSVPDAQLKTLGLTLNNSSTGTKFSVRGAGTALQYIDTAGVSFTTLTEDTTAASAAFLSASSTTPMVWSQFNTALNSVSWGVGAGASTILGVYSTSKVTQNGVSAPGGSVTPTVNAAGTGTFTTAGTYRYAFALRKTSTQVVSNVAVEISATLANATDTVTLPLTLLTGIDTTKHDKIYIYRSAVAGAVGFTTGDIVAQVASNATTYTDTGSSVSSSQNVPRAGNTVLDNSTLPSGTYKTLVTWKRRLFTASGSTINGTDVNKPESWPLANTLTIPSGGPITSLSIISFTSSGSNTIDELLCVHKENELWVITGNGDLSDLTNTSLKFIDYTGAPNQSVIVNANGYIFWLSYDEIYMWSGVGKPIKCARLIKPYFYKDGDIDKTKLTYAHGVYYKKLDQVIWFLSHKIYGEQQFQLKMDLRLTLPSVQPSLGGSTIDAVFIPDSTPFPVYSAVSFLPSTPEETLFLGDGSGYLYQAFNAESDAGGAISFKYATKPHDCGNPNMDKRFTHIIVWVEELGTWDLTLDWWTDYKASDNDKSTRALPISTVPSASAAIWDLAQWDSASWDDYTPKLKPLYFQLASDALNNSEGKSIRLQFRQEGSDQPVTISGYSIIYAPQGMKKAVA